MSPLYAFQETGAAWLAPKKFAVLADDPGLGKTPQAIVAADKIGATHVLVVAPAIVLPTWAREWPTWQRIPRSIQIIRSSAEAEQIHGDVVLVSYSRIDKIRDKLRGLAFDLAIFDEAQALKNPNAVRTKAAYGRDGLIGCTRRVWLLSGTLAPNHPGELWTHYRVLFRGPLNYPEFIDRYCTTKETTYGRQITGANPAHTAELGAFLHPRVLQRRQRDVLPDLPELRWGHVPVSPAKVPPKPEITIEESAILGRLERDESLSVKDQMHLATLRRWTGIAKAPVVVELLQADLESIDKLVVFGVHRQVLSTIAEGLGSVAAVIDGSTPQATRQALIDAFQTADQPRVLVLQIGVAGVALTLHRANHVVFVETTWTPADMVQAAKRCHRIGQGRSVLARVVSLAGSIDEQVAGIVTRKARELAELENLINRESPA